DLNCTYPTDKLLILNKKIKNSSSFSTVIPTSFASLCMFSCRLYRSQDILKFVEIHRPPAGAFFQ
ncbi:hypothetical protein, partial [Pseudomonas gingeri]|uniref:hypothetical protein n=1 Tax=Pseudomonas gingeri TaxID=117681 RepID=UPI001C4D9745